MSEESPNSMKELAEGFKSLITPSVWEAAQKEHEEEERTYVERMKKLLSAQQD